jgi:hypothetical protein
METKLHNIQNNLKDKLAAVTYNMKSIDCSLNGNRGRSGGIILLWDPCTCNIEFNNMDFNYIDILITNLSNSL